MSGKRETIPTLQTYSHITKSTVSSPFPLSSPLSLSFFKLIGHRLSATELGGPSKGVYFVPHGAYVAQAEKNLGPEIVDANYPMDHTHTAPFLADVVAKSFALGLKCGTSPLQDLVINATSRMEGSVLGTCLPANERVPI
jgi:hypothetical protein